MVDSLEQKFAEVFEQLDREGRLQTILMAYALKRKDPVLRRSLEELATMPTQENGVEIEVDYDLLGQIRNVCPHDESLTWARLLVCCLGRGDERKVAVLHDMMRRRVAS